MDTCFLEKQLFTSDQLTDLNFLEGLINIDSQTDNVFGVKEVQKSIALRLEKMGLKNKFIANERVISGQLLQSELAGRKDFWVTFIAHADTALNCASTKKRCLDIRSERLYCPGIADNKSGVVIACRGVREFLRRNPHPNIGLRFVISPNEEVGSPGFHYDLKKIGEESQIILGFEPALKDGRIIHSRNGNRWYHIKIHGKGGHAGRLGKDSLNPAHALAKVVQEIVALNCLCDGISLNIGSLETNHDRFNVVSEYALAKLDVRFDSVEKRDLLHHHIEKILHQLNQTILSQGQFQSFYSIEDDCPPLENNGESKPFEQAYLDFIQHIEAKEFTSDHSGGAADICYTVAANSIAFDGLGPIGGNMHGDDEYIVTQSLWNRSLALTKFLSFIDEQIGLASKETQ